MSDAVEIAPCPFCGRRDASIVSDISGYGLIGFYRCYACGAAGPRTGHFSTSDRDTKAMRREARELWNERA